MTLKNSFIKTFEKHYYFNLHNNLERHRYFMNAIAQIIMYQKPYEMIIYFHKLNNCLNDVKLFTNYQIYHFPENSMVQLSTLPFDQI